MSHRTAKSDFSFDLYLKTPNEIGGEKMNLQKSIVFRYLKLTAILLLCTVLVYSCCSRIYHDIKDAYTGMCEYQLSDFRSHKSDFAHIAEIMVNAYKSEKSNNPAIEYLVVFSGPSSNEWAFYCDAGGNSTWDYMITQSASEEDIKAFDGMRKAMYSKMRQGCDQVRVDDKCVKFRTMSPYYIVYDYSGDFYKTAKNDDRITINRIAWKWYEVLIVGNG